MTKACFSPYRWSAHLLDALVQSGVRHAVISPGSRSTPLTLAAADHPSIETSIHLDERSAGFFALGIGKVTGLPAVLICTSGTAVAGYLPAVLEARNSGVPLVILSADRPPGLRGTGASQTIDQIKLFGDAAVFFHEAGEPVGESADLGRLRLAGAQAVRYAVRRGGASHINLPFRKPLEPVEGERDAFQFSSLKMQKNDAEVGFADSDGFADAARSTDVARSMDAARSMDVARSMDAARSMELPESLVLWMKSTKKPLCIAGPAHPHTAFPEALDFAVFLNAPLLAEPGSHLRFSASTSASPFVVTAADAVLATTASREHFKPDLILQFGHNPVSSSLLKALDAWNDVPVIRFVRQGDGQPEDAVELVTLQNGTDSFSLVTGVFVPQGAKIRMPLKFDSPFDRDDDGGSPGNNRGDDVSSPGNNRDDDGVSPGNNRGDDDTKLDLVNRKFVNEEETGTSVVAETDTGNIIPTQTHPIHGEYAGTNAGTNNIREKWLEDWMEAESNMHKKIRSALSDSHHLTDPHVFHHLSKKVSGYGIMVSNSLPVRDMALFGSHKVPATNSITGNHESEPHFTGQFVNRGAAGIDGILSTAAGMTYVSSREGPFPETSRIKPNASGTPHSSPRQVASTRFKKWACFIGDLAFFHDSNALMALNQLQLPVIVFVINNGGGTIFRMLPVADQADVYLDYFETPQQVSIQDLVRAHRLHYQRVETLQELFDWAPPPALNTPLIVECMTDPDASFRIRQFVKGSAPSVKNSAP